MVKIICKEDCGNSPKRILLRDFNIAVAKGDFSFVKQHIAEGITWHLFEPAGQKIITGPENILDEFMHNFVIVPVELLIETIITHGHDGAVNGRIEAKDGNSYVFSDFYKFNSAKGTKIKIITSHIIKVKK